MSQKRILLTGATDGIGLETARRLASLGHQLLLHGRSRSKLDCVESDLRTEFNGSVNEGYVADLSDLSAVKKLAGEVRSKHESIDVLINNAGVFMTPTPRTRDGLDVRFVVNSVSPYLLTQQLLPIIPSDGRVINLSSAAQSRVDLLALSGKVRVGDSEAYAQSKLAITMWTRSMAESLGSNAPVIVAVNPGSFLNSKMVQQAYGRPGKDLGIGVSILVRAALSHDFADANGKYFDNDTGRFASPNPDTLDSQRCEELITMFESVIKQSVS